MMQANEKNSVMQMLERESKREKNLEARAKELRQKEARRRAGRRRSGREDSVGGERQDHRGEVLGDGRRQGRGGGGGASLIGGDAAASRGHAAEEWGTSSFSRREPELAQRWPLALRGHAQHGGVRVHAVAARSASSCCAVRYVASPHSVSDRPCGVESK